MVLKIHGGGNLPLVQCIFPEQDEWLVLWNKVHEEDESFVYSGAVIDHKPTIEDIKTLINSHINEKVASIINGGLVIDGNIVWLSLENQLNYKAAYDLAKQSGGANLPVTFKFGEGCYKTYETVDELQTFYLAVRRHIDAAVAAGWEEKKLVDYSEYQKILDTI